MNWGHMPKRTIGFVYVLRNPRDPDLAKIGFTTRLAEDRAKELSGSSVPAQFEVVFSAPTSHPRELERYAHQKLADFRFNDKREFFEVTPEIAIETIMAGRIQVDGIGAWQSDRVHYIGSGDRLMLSANATDFFVLLAMEDPLMSSGFDPLDFWQAHSDGDTLELMGTDNPGAVAGLSDNDENGTTDPIPFIDREGKSPSDTINGLERLVPGDRLMWIAVNESEETVQTSIFEMRTHCQVVGRTRAMKFSPDGYPLLMNVPTFQKLPELSLEPIRKAMAMPPPRSWAPRNPDPEHWAPIGTDPQPPGYWLPQLNRKKK